MKKELDLFRLDQRYTEQASWTKQVLQNLIAQLPKPCRVLEVGCGTGAVLRNLIPQLTLDQRLYGIDIDLASLHYSGLSDLFNAQASQLPFADGSFDLVFCHFLLLWIEQPQTVLCEMKRVCASCGIVAALAEPDYDAAAVYPQSLAELVDQQRHYLASCGADVSAGRKMAGWFHSAGFANVTSGVFSQQLELPSRRSFIKSELRQLAEDTNLPERSFIGDETLFIPTFFAYSGRK